MMCARADIAVDTGVRIEVCEPSKDFNLTVEARTSIRVVLDVEHLTDDVERSDILGKIE